jgi:uncharacterized surface protein with fasciclin (FAS1) repeats
MFTRTRLAVLASAAALAIVPLGATSAAASDDTIVAAAAGSPNHTTLVAALQAAGLVDTLAGSGPFTVFAPTDAAFGKLPAGTVDTLLQPANRGQLQAVLTYHVVPGKVTAAELVEAIRAGDGSATLTTVQGGTLTARLSGGGVAIVDANGGAAMVTQADLAGSNGLIHVTDAVSLPR